MNVSVGEVLSGQAAPLERTVKNRLIGFVALQHVIIDIMILPVAAAPYALAGGQVDAKLFFFLLVALLVSISTNVINDLADVERDKTKWPLRPLPTGLVSKQLALTCIFVTAGVALVIAGVLFNLLFVALVLLLIAFATVYVVYTRDHIGHLTTVLPIASVPVVAWSAVSPETILTPLPWLLVLLTAVMVPPPQLFNQERIPGKVLLVRFKPSTKKALCVASAALTFLIGTALFFYAQLAWPFMVVMTAFVIWTLAQVRYLGRPDSVEKLTAKTPLFFVWLSVFWGTIALLAWIK
jgi:4-hydroxybenzoate polyprenyltransferase